MTVRREITIVNITVNKNHLTDIDSILQRTNKSITKPADLKSAGEKYEVPYYVRLRCSGIARSPICKPSLTCSATYVQKLGERHHSRR